VTDVPLAADVRFLIVTPEAAHRLADSPYNERRESCELAARALAALLPGRVESLRDVSPADFERYRGRLPVEAAMRAAHIVGEIDRVARGVAALRSGDIDAFGALMYESHESSRAHSSRTRARSSTLRLGRRAIPERQGARFRAAVGAEKL
jgi:galactokinase